MILQIHIIIFGSENLEGWIRTREAQVGSGLYIYIPTPELRTLKNSTLLLILITQNMFDLNSPNNNLDSVYYMSDVGHV